MLLVSAAARGGWFALFGLISAAVLAWGRFPFSDVFAAALGLEVLPVLDVVLHGCGLKLEARLRCILFFASVLLEELDVSLGFLVGIFCLVLLGPVLVLS